MSEAWTLWYTSVSYWMAGGLLAALLVVVVGWVVLEALRDRESRDQ